MWLAVIESLRPRQWTKNLFVLAPLVFSKSLFTYPLNLIAVEAALLFCLASGCVYIMNDLLDIENDRRHPVKANRPLASGRLSVRQAKVAEFLLVPICLLLSYHLGFAFLLMVVGYLVLCLAYSLFLRKVFLLDVFIIALGFMIRIVAGAVVIDVKLSQWIIMCSLLLALFLALSKRRHEAVLMGLDAHKYRSVLKDYNQYFLDQAIAVVAASTLITYGLYTMSANVLTQFGNNHLVFTFPLVVYGILRCLYLSHSKVDHTDPIGFLFNDRHMLAVVCLWSILVFIILYL
jgi:4-hydroxybenzoate polyprenyltransferase